MDGKICSERLALIVDGPALIYIMKQYASLLCLRIPLLVMSCGLRCDGLL